MANTCCIDIEIQFNNPADASACYSWFEAQQHKATAEDKCMIFGDSKFEIADDCISMPSNLDIDILGSVRWFVDEDKFVNFVRLLVKHYDIAFVKCHYEEFGCQLYGVYEYEPVEKTVTDYRVPESYFDAYDGPFETDEDIENFENYIHNCPDDDYEIEAIAEL